MDWFKLALSKYAQFTGRSRRKEYWNFILFYFLISIVVSLIDRALGLYHEDTGAGVLGGVLSLVMLIPNIAVGVRRLHDTSRSGWWYLLIFLPVIGWIILIVFFVQDSVPGTNEYGPNPKSLEADLEDHLVG